MAAREPTAKPLYDRAAPPATADQAAANRSSAEDTAVNQPKRHTKRSRKPTVAYREPDNPSAYARGPQARPEISTVAPSPRAVVVLPPREDGRGWPDRDARDRYLRDADRDRWRNREPDGYGPGPGYDRGPIGGLFGLFGGGGNW